VERTLKRTAFLLGPLLFLGMAFSLHPARADGPGDTATTDNSTPPPAVAVEDTVRFFHEFVSKTRPPGSDPFSVKPEDGKLPATWDRSRIVYFPVMADAQSTSAVPSNGGTFYYSLWNQNLAAYGGWKADHVEGGWRPRKTRQIQIRRGIEGLRQHEATLGMGGAVTVVDYSVVDYVLYLHGTETCPPNVFDPGSGRFTLTTRLLPSDARSLSSHMQMVIGVRLRSYSASYTFGK
jgi:uncharacterized protein YbdZ (MbtH family)